MVAEIKNNKSHLDNQSLIGVVKDNSSVECNTLDDVIPNILNEVLDKTLYKLQEEGIFVFPNLLSESNDLNGDQFILQKINNKYKTSNVVGVIGLGNETLIIKSRFSEDNALKDDFFLKYMLQKVFDFPNIVDLKIGIDQDNNLFDLLCFIFPYYLKKALRKGVFKTYICKSNNDKNLKGRLDIANHIRQNTPFLGKLSYTQRLYSYDNYMTELIRHTIEFINTKKYSKLILSKVKDEVSMIVESTPTYDKYNRDKIIKENQKYIIRHAYYKEYRFLQALCFLILKQNKINISCVHQKQYGILFDGSYLFEEYINLLVNKDDKYFYHSKNKQKDGKQYLFNKIGAIYPDFIGKDNNIIADAKYKPLCNITGRDYQQILAYMYRFDSKTGIYFYPNKEDEKDKEKKLFLNQGSSFHGNVSVREGDKAIIVIKKGITIPKADSYIDFVRLMEKKEEDFLSDLYGIFKDNLVKNIQDN